jgi:hypothetical protein
MGLFGPDADKVFSKGVSEQARLTGIKVSTDGSESRTEVTAFGLQRSNGTTVGVRQQLDSMEYLRLGMEVDIRSDGNNVVIDWASTLGRIGRSGSVFTHRWKMLKDAPTGIVDETLGLKRKNATEGAFTVVALREKTVLGFVPTLSIDGVVQLTGQLDYQASVGGVAVPGYASHLAVAGAVLRCVVPDGRLDKPKIDWATSAQLQPGVGVPPADERDEPTSTDRAFVGEATEASVRSQIDTAASAAQSSGGVSLDTFVAVQVGLQLDAVKPADHDSYAQRHGVPAGMWASVSAEWMSKMNSDWRVGAAFGEAFEAAQKQRKKAR